MIVFLTVFLFAAIGAFIAWRRKGKALDMLHYAGSFAMIGLIVGVLLTIGISRAG